jgi:hypothetical protein
MPTWRFIIGGHLSFFETFLGTFRLVDALVVKVVQEETFTNLKLFIGYEIKEFFWRAIETC